MTLTLASALREMFGVQLYKNNACALLSRILNILNLDWLQHARSVRGVYGCTINHLLIFCPFLTTTHFLFAQEMRQFNTLTCCTDHQTMYIGFVSFHSQNQLNDMHILQRQTTFQLLFLYQASNEDFEGAW